MTFSQFTEFVACTAFAGLLWAPESTHATIAVAEVVGLFVGRRYGGKQ